MFPKTRNWRYQMFKQKCNFFKWIPVWEIVGLLGKGIEPSSSCYMEGCFSISQHGEPRHGVDASPCLDTYGSPWPQSLTSPEIIHGFPIARPGGSNQMTLSRNPWGWNHLLQPRRRQSILPLTFSHWSISLLRYLSYSIWSICSQYQNWHHNCNF